MPRYWFQMKGERGATTSTCQTTTLLIPSSYSGAETFFRMSNANYLRAGRSNSVSARATGASPR